MTELKPACLEALAAIETDPLDLPPAVAAHVSRCTACSEARVAWLALEDAPPAQPPAGYFDQLPARILRKLPARPRPQGHAYLWALAAALLLAVGVGGFYLGRANSQPMEEASLASAPLERATTLPETPFLENDDTMTRLHKLKPEEAKALIDRLDAKESKP